MVLVDRWQRLTFRQRTTIGTVLFVGAVGLLSLSITPDTSWQPIGGGRAFTAKEIAAIQSAWRERGLVQFRREGRTLIVPASELARYEAALPAADNVAPSNEWEKQLAGVNVFTSSEELAQRKENALRNELRRVLKAIPAIADADVIWARSKNRSAFSPRAKVTATINVTPREGADLTPELAQSLRAAVAGMVPDLEPEDITILDQSTGLAITQDSAALIAAQQRRRQHERSARQLESRLATALADIPHAVVQAKRVELPAPDKSHIAAKPVLGLAFDWMPEASNRWLDFTPWLDGEVTPSGASTHNSDPVEAWQVVVHIPENYFDARAAQQWVTARPQSLNLDELRDAECARVQQLVRNAMPADALLAEVSVIPTTSTGTTVALPFAAWPHVVCGLCAVLCLAFAARFARARPTEERNPPSLLLDDSSMRNSEQPADVAVTPVATEAGGVPLPVANVPSVAVTDLARLQQLDPLSLADLLRHERPQAVAVLLTRFPTWLASACLSRFPRSLQTDVIRRLKSLGEVPDELVAEVARAVGQRLTAAVEATSPQPTNRVAHLLTKTTAKRAVA